METTDTFDRIQDDPHAWVERADCLFISAKQAEIALKEAMTKPATFSDVRLQQLAFLDSFMMLTAFAFENLIKGLGVAKGKHWTHFHEQSGHGIAAYAERATTVSAEERSLLQRLQIFSIWAGRYPIPKKPSKYQADAPQRKFSIPRDIELIDKFKARLKSEFRAALTHS